MNKIAIPALLVATVMVAGLFAFAPVEQASTVHTSGVSTSVRDTVSIPFTAAFVVAQDDAYPIMDNAGIGGTMDIEIVWKIADQPACEIRTSPGAVVAADDGALDGIETALNHDDVENVELVYLWGNGANCDLAANDFITITVIGTD